jgi:site-specific recombinase XerD
MEELIRRIIAAMGNDLTAEQNRKLENVLIIKLTEFLHKDTEVSTTPADWEKILNHYLGCKKLENCADGTIANYRRTLQIMYSAVGKNIRDITANDLRYFMARYIETRKISLQYSENIRHILTGFFGWAQDEGIINVNPAKKLQRIKVPKRIKKPYTAEERLRLTRAANHIRDMAIMEVLYSTAGRLGEVLALNKSDVHFIGNKAEAVIYGKKGKAERKVCLTEQSVYYLRCYLETRTDDDPALFVSTRRPHKRLDERAVQVMIRKLGAQCGVEAHPHKFRRTLLTDMSKRGANIQDIKEYAGHVKIETTMLYISTSEESVKSAFNRCIS